VTVRERRDLVKDRQAVRCETTANNLGDLTVQNVHTLVSMHPGIRERFRIEGPELRAQFRQLEKPGPFRDEQSDR
jgi:hypothetical protein